jgi:hypothetical protein
VSNLTDVREQVQEWIDYLNQYNDIAERDLRRFRDLSYARAFARALLAGGRNRLGGYEFSITNLRELNGHEFPTVLATNRRIRCVAACASLWVIDSHRR